MSTAGRPSLPFPIHVLILLLEGEDTPTGPPIEDEVQNDTKTSVENPRTSTESTSSGTSNLVGSLGRVSISSEIPRESDSHVVLSFFCLILYVY